MKEAIKSALRDIRIIISNELHYLAFKAYPNDGCKPIFYRNLQNFIKLQIAKDESTKKTSLSENKE